MRKLSIGKVKRMSEIEKYVLFDGIRYTRQKDGRYVGSYGKLLHRAIWEHFKGEIPEGYVIHHIDGDPSNNDLANLQMMTQSEHMKLHHAFRKSICAFCGKEFESRGNLSGKSRFCSKKCRSDWDHKNNREIRICAICGREFETYKYGKTKCCSKKCAGRAISRSKLKKNRR